MPESSSGACLGKGAKEDAGDPILERLAARADAAIIGLRPKPGQQAYDWLLLVFTQC
jgi:hypothetical protein